MQPERPYYISPIEKELHFIQWAEKNNIKQFLFDLDDTICDTGKLFYQQMSQAYDFLNTNYPQIPRDQWQKEIEDGNNKSFEKLGVNPGRWNLIVDELADKYPLSLETKSKTKTIFQEIFNIPVEMLDGAEKCLTFLTKINIPIGIVTHANRGDTFKKYNWLKLDRFINWDDIYIVDENGHKTHESWQDAIKYFHLNPKNCAVVGDSPRSDINPAHQAGVQHCFLVERSNSWSVHQQSVHSDTVRIKNLSELIGLGTEKL